MGHTGGVIPKDATPFTACIDSGANRQAMSVASGDGRSSTGHGDSLINSDDTSTIVDMVRVSARIGGASVQISSVAKHHITSSPLDIEGV